MIKNLRYLMPALALLVASCEKDDDSSSSGSSSAKYVVSLRTQATVDETADYMLMSNDLMSGEITAEGQGVEQLGWTFGGTFGGTHFSFSTENDECTGYKVKSGALVEQGTYVSRSSVDILAPLDDDYFLTIGAPWGGGSYNCYIDIIDIDGVAISASKDHPLYETYYGGTQLNAWPTGAYLEDDRLFITFYPLNGTTWETPVTDSAFISVFSYPELEYIKTIKDSRTSPIGYYSGQACIIEDESGNHYFLSSSSYLAGYTQATNPSGVLKIDAGAEEFNSSYFFNVENTGYKVMSGVYAGNGKVVARVSSTANEVAANAWGAFSVSTPALYVAVLDLYNETVTIVDDVPAHGGQYQTPYLEEDGKVYISVNNGTEAYVYQVDASTATATQGAKIIGNELQMISAN